MAVSVWRSKIASARRSRFAGKEHSLKAGDVVLMTAEVLHGVTARSRLKWMLVMLKAAGEGDFPSRLVPFESTEGYEK
jgi:hypothetical protein